MSAAHPNGRETLSRSAAGDRNPWLNSVLGFELQPETTREEAERLAGILNSYIVAIGLT